MVAHPLAGTVAAMRAALPWLMVLTLLTVVSAPLVLTNDALFIDGLHGDLIATIWFYDLVGRTLPETPATLAAFDWPTPYAVAKEFPSTVDAALGGLWLRAQGWVAGWGEVQATILAVNTLGAAALAYAAGCRGAGVVLAGGLGLLCRQLWFDLVGARLNAAWPGLSMGALAAALMLLTPRLHLAARLGLVAAGGLLGALAAHIYPPHLVGFAPLGLILLAGPARRSPRALLWAAAPVTLALLLSVPALQVIAETRAGRDCSRLMCPDRFHVLRVEDLARYRPAFGGLNQPGVNVTAWLALPLVLLHTRRWTLLLGAVSLLPALLLSLGPCPSWGSQPLAGLRTLEAWSGLWCALHQLSDYGRGATVAAMGAAVLAGLGAEALPRWWLRWPVALGLVGLTGWMFFNELTDPGKWRQPAESPAGVFLAGAAVGPVADLPYDRAGQFWSALAAPDHPRTNPLKLQPPPSQSAALKWVHALGAGRPDDMPAPSRAQLADEVGLRWVLFEPSRCDLPQTRCAPGTVDRISAALGPPTVHGEGALYSWDLSPR